MELNKEFSKEEIPTGKKFFCLFSFAFQERVSLCSLGYPGTSLDQAGLELRDSPVSSPQLLGLKPVPPCPERRNNFRSE